MFFVVNCKLFKAENGDIKINWLNEIRKILMSQFEGAKGEWIFYPLPRAQCIVCKFVKLKVG